MAVHEGKKIIEKYRTGSFQWNSTETVIFLKGHSSGSSFEFSGFDSSLCTERYTLTNLRECTVFYLKNTKFPKWFSRSYKLTLINNEGKECYTAKGSIRKETENITLMTVFDKYLNEQLHPPGQALHLRISWFDDEGCDVSEKGVQVYPESTEVFDRSVQTEEPKFPSVKDKCTSTEKDPIALLEALSNDLEHFYERKTGTDCVLRVGKEQFPVHRQVLSARSTVFEAMFRHDTSESRSGTVDNPDIEADVMSDVLFYAYTGKIRSLTADSAVPMYVVADKYALMELRNKCMHLLLHGLTLENFSDAAVLAHTHGETELENKVVLFIEERLKELMDNENWKTFLKNKAVLASRLLCSALLAKQERIDKMSSK